MERPSEEQVDQRSDLLPEEERAGSDDPRVQAEAILEESEERTAAAAQGEERRDHFETRRSEDTVEH